MFEGKPPFAHEASASAADAKAGEQLRTLSWSDLVAKLEAARDLRAVFSGDVAPRDCISEASFDAHCAHHLAEQQDHFPANSKSPVNPLDSGNRKYTCGKEVPDNTGQDGVSRGRT